MSHLELYDDGSDLVSSSKLQEWDWRKHRKMKRTYGNDAVTVVKWLSFIGLRAPHSYTRMMENMRQIGMLMKDALWLASHVGLGAFEEIGDSTAEYDHWLILSSLQLYCFGCRRRNRAYHFYKHAAKIPVERNTEVDHPLILHTLGMYKKSNSLLRGHQRFNSRMQAVNYFYLEQYEQTIVHCQRFGPLTNGTRYDDDPWIITAIFGIYVASLIQTKQHNKARELLLKGISKEWFKMNFIITYCAFVPELLEGDDQEKLIERKDYSHQFIAHHAVLNRVYHGMLFLHSARQYDDSQWAYQYAIRIFHECTFYGAHPINLFRLHECYADIGLYERALRYLDRAQRTAKGNIPSINKDYGEKRTRIKMQLKSMRCHGCGAGYDVGNRLYPCADCLKVFYCNRKCQKRGWKEGFHREHCDKEFVGFKAFHKRAMYSPFRVAHYRV